MGILEAFLFNLLKLFVKQKGRLDEAVRSSQPLHQGWFRALNLAHHQEKLFVVYACNPKDGTFRKSFVKHALGHC